MSSIYTVIVNNGNSDCSGFIYAYIKSKLYVVTAAHNVLINQGLSPPVQQVSNISCIINQKSINMSILGLDINADIAVLISEKIMDSYTIIGIDIGNLGNLGTGTEIISIYNNPDSTNISTRHIGTVCSYNTFNINTYNYTEQIIVSCSSYNGSSGAPIISSKNKIVGMILWQKFEGGNYLFGPNAQTLTQSINKIMSNSTSGFLGIQKYELVSTPTFGPKITGAILLEITNTNTYPLNIPKSRVNNAKNLSTLIRDGLQVGDILLSIDDLEIGLYNLRNINGLSYYSNKKVVIKILRNNRKIKYSVTPDTFPTGLLYVTKLSNWVDIGSDVEGNVGATGPKGVDNTTIAGQGATGLIGPNGINSQGQTGPSGVIGQSKVGATGPNGIIGATGPTGSSGHIGPGGPLGLSGGQGSTGATGATGPTGIGIIGATGSTGPIGFNGITGASGYVTHTDQTITYDHESLNPIPINVNVVYINNLSDVLGLFTLANATSNIIITIYLNYYIMPCAILCSQGSFILDQNKPQIQLFWNNKLWEEINYNNPRFTTNVISQLTGITNSVGTSVFVSNNSNVVVYTDTPGTLYAVNVGSESPTSFTDPNSLYTCVAISADGTTIITGAPNYPPGEPTHGSLTYLKYDGNAITQYSLLAGPDISDQLGISVALSADGNVAMAGLAIGSVYVINMSTFLVYTQITPTDAIDISQFGQAISISGNGQILAISGPNDNLNAGAVWIYSYSPQLSLATEVIKITQPGTSFLGNNVAISEDGTTLVFNSEVGTPGQGRIWIYICKNGNWVLQTVIANTDNTISLGTGLSLSNNGNTLVVLYNLYKGLTPGGIVFYTRTEGNWTSRDYCNNLTIDSGLQINVSLSGDGSTAVSGNPSYIGSSANGVVSIYQ